MYDLLEGIRVLEIAIAAPDGLGAHLAEMGADVVKIEKPPLGDTTRLLRDGGFINIRSAVPAASPAAASAATSSTLTATALTRPARPLRAAL